MCFSPQRRNKCNEEMSHRRLLIDHGDSTSNVENLLRGQQFFNSLTSWLAFRHSGGTNATAVLNMFTSKRAFGHSIVQFCNIRTYKSGPNTSCFVHFHFPMCFSPQGRTILQHQNLQKWSKHVMFCAFSLPNVLFATGSYNFATSELTKVVQTRHVLCIFTSQCAFRHRCMHFFNIRTYKSGPNTSCFVHFHFRMYLSPQRCVIFRHLNVQKCSKHLMFCTFSLPHVLFATAAYNFSTS